MSEADELCSGIANGGVLSLQLYTHRRQKLTLLHLHWTKTYILTTLGIHWVCIGNVLNPAN